MSNKFLSLTAWSLCASLSLSVWADTTDAANADLQFINTWVREAPPTATMSAAYMRIENTSKRDRQLISGSSAQFDHVEVHETIMEQDIAKMRHIEALTIPAEGAVELKPGGYHVMLMHRNTPLKEGDTVDLTLVFADKSTVELTVEVKKAENMTESK